jgi:hypothetical protein
MSWRVVIRDSRDRIAHQLAAVFDRESAAYVAATKQAELDARGLELSAEACQSLPPRRRGEPARSPRRGKTRAG